MVNNPFSFKGWNFSIWLGKNKESLKLLVSGATGLLTAMIANLSPTYSVALGVVVAAVSKMLIDSIDYYQSP